MSKIPRQVIENSDLNYGGYSVKEIIIFGYNSAQFTFDSSLSRYSNFIKIRSYYNIVYIHGATGKSKQNGKRRTK